MKRTLYLTILFVLFSIVSTSAQKLPVFLEGTWKLENKETYEHWDLVNTNKLKGFSYKLIDGKMSVTEYLEINKRGEDIIYTATVINQNQGVGIDFKLVQSVSLYSFENDNHDFPKFIRYQLVSENKLKATVGTNENSYTLVFQKVK